MEVLAQVVANRGIATYGSDGGYGTGGSDDGGSGTQRVDWQWQTGHSIELHLIFIQLIVSEMLMIYTLLFL